MGVIVWPMIELAADDALPSAAHIAANDKKVEKVAMLTPDKDRANACQGGGWCRSTGDGKLFGMRRGYAKSLASIRR
jgi:hypothetical protein